VTGYYNACFLGDGGGLQCSIFHYLVQEGCLIYGSHDLSPEVFDVSVVKSKVSNTCTYQCFSIKLSVHVIYKMALTAGIYKFKTWR
jgi:hypothetical protein